jgi:hypothetical protein
MNELFRFVAIRPPQRALPVFTLRLAFESSPFIIALLAARASDNPRAAMIAAAREFQGSPEFIAVPAQLALFEQLVDFEQTVTETAPTDLDDLDQRVAGAFGMASQEVRSLPEFQQHKRNCSDSIIAVKIAPVADTTLLPELARLARLLDLVERIARREEALLIPGAIAAVLAEALIIPETFFPLPPAPTLPLVTQPNPQEEERRERMTALRTRASALRGTLKRLLATTPRDLPPPSAVVPRQSTARLVRPRSLLERLTTRLVPAPGRTVQSDGANVVDTSREVQLLRSDVVARFSPNERALLAELNVDLAQTPVPAALRRVEAELRAVGEQLAALEPRASRRAVVRIGSTFVPVQAPQAVPALGLSALEGAGVPETVGTVRPIGVGNLMLVRQQIKRYEAGEIAHIENVLQGEAKERSTRRLERTEQSFTLVTESTTEEERDLQTTEHFAFQQEASKTVQQDESFNAGVSISAGYGPYFQVNSNIGFSSATSTSEAARKAFSYAKDVTERTAKRITERVRREEVINTLREWEENNRHELNNVGGTGHVIGQYRWIDKIYEAQVFDYGLRTLFSFILPEPAALFLRALEARRSAADELDEPLEFTALPSEIDETTYGQFVLQYQATGVEPPPRATLTVSRAFDASAATPGADFTKSERIDLPDGYHAYQAHLANAFIRWTSADGTSDGDPIEADVPVFRINIGREHFERHHGDPKTQTITLAEERESLPVSIVTLWVASYAVNIEIECLLDTRHFEKWQLETHAAIMQAYQQRRSEYEEKLAAAAAQAGVQIEGRNPAENRRIELAELKRGCISLLTAQHFELFGAILESGGTLPQIDFEEAAAEGHYIQFFEHAFEWENIAYVFYPYFWGRRSGWLDRMTWSDVDPVHAEFLKAGAARVVVPVRPGFDTAVLHFLDSGEVWNGGDLPTIGNPLYVDILEEIQARLGAPGTETAVFEPWDVRLPTTLVRLDATPALPEWEKDEAGVWREVEVAEDA